MQHKINLYNFRILLMKIVFAPKPNLSANHPRKSEDSWRHQKVAKKQMSLLRHKPATYAEITAFRFQQSIMLRLCNGDTACFQGDEIELAGWCLREAV